MPIIGAACSPPWRLNDGLHVQSIDEPGLRPLSESVADRLRRVAAASIGEPKNRACRPRG